MKYNVNGMILTRCEFVRYLCGYIHKSGCADQVRNILPRYTIAQNVKHHPVRIARELDINVIVIDEYIDRR